MLAPPDRPSSAADPPPRVLAIAGSDSGGGAGIQADLKALAACGVHGMTAITAITAQSTVGVRSVHSVPGDMIVEQVRAVTEDIGVDAVKIGMLGTRAAIEAVEEALALVGDAPVVVDPVMVAESGATLLDADAREALRDRLVPRATVVTPNIAEAAVLAADGGQGAAREPAEALARAVHGLGPHAVVVTGGHAEDLADGNAEEVTDLLFDGAEPVAISGAREPGGAAHGSGCTHSSALAAQLARGVDLLGAARAARSLAGAAVRNGLRGVGAGAGPVDALDIGRRACAHG